jgi:crossover junction endodeoxyribonuclease RuvC
VTVLGIDPGMAAWGFGAVERSGNRVRLVEHGWHRTDPAEPPEQRLQRIHDAVAELLSRLAPDQVALEDSYVGIDRRAALAVGQARGAILVACARYGVACAQYPPAMVKQAVCGYGKADKTQVQRMVRAILGLDAEPRPHHAADALAVAVCHALSSPVARLAAHR